MMGFHGDGIARDVVRRAVEAGVTALVETGTHRGGTSGYMAEKFPHLTVYTCEIDKRYFEAAGQVLSRFPNVVRSPESSEKFVSRLITEGMLGDCPFFYLDAHWHDYWPLQDELLAISRLPRFVIMIDDFQVPGQPQFEWGCGNGGSFSGTVYNHRTQEDFRDNRICGLTAISRFLPEGCRISFPRYDKMAAYGKSNAPHLRGYCVISKGVDVQFDSKLFFQVSDPKHPLAVLEAFPKDNDETETAIVVASCSKFHQAWEPFFTLFRRFWPDCPYRMFFVTDSGGGQYNAAFEGVQNLVVPEDMGWSSNMIWALPKINAHHIIFFQEDFFIKDKVDSGSVSALVRYARDNDIGCLRLCACPGPSSVWKDDFLGLIQDEDDNRLSMQASIWNRKLFSSLLRAGESPWDFEKYGALRSKKGTQPFLSLWREAEDHPGGPIKYIITGIVGCTWQKDALNLFKREGISTDGITEKIS